MANTSSPSGLTWLVLATRVLSAVAFRFITAPVRLLNWKGAATLFEDVFFVAFRTMLRHSNLAVSRVIFKPTTDVYNELCKQTGRQPKTLDVNGLKAHWIGDESADVVVLYFHGGGYTQPASPDHLKYLDLLAQDINTRAGGNSIAFLVLAYSLAPEQAVFPTQLREAASMLSHLVTNGRNASSIMLAGDSAGGGLALALLSHILHPKEGVPPVNLQEPLRGAILYSPFVSFSTDFGSYKRNEESDTLSAFILTKWASMYSGEMDASTERPVTWEVKSNDVYAEAFLAEPSWWSGLDRVVESILVWAGGKEILRDAVVDFVTKLKLGWKSKGGQEEGIILIEGRDEAHIGPILNISLGEQREEELTSGNFFHLNPTCTGKGVRAMATTTYAAIETISYQEDLGNMTYNVTVSDDVFTLVAQNIMCAYPISDIYAPAPRYLYYVLLFLTFATLRYKWLSHVFLGAAVTYAACAAINVFIIIATPPSLQKVQNVTVPFIPSDSNYTKGVDAIGAIVTNTTIIKVQPDAVELDIDPITAVVVSACLVGLPLQIWSRTLRSSIVIRYMILLWNIIMLAASICALTSWPTTNLASPQYRFCYAGFLDSDSQASDGWDLSYWKGNWNATVHNIFDHPQTIWQELSNNCFYPCFNTSQVIRQSQTLKAVVSTGKTKFAKLHNPVRGGNDEFAPLIYVAVIVFAVAQFFLYFVSVLRLGSDALRATIHEPHHLWRKRKHVWQQLAADARHGWQTMSAICRLPVDIRGGRRRRDDASTPQFRDLVPIFRLLVDVIALVILVAVFLLSPLIVVAFICWIEWYIRNDGSANETINQVGQWAPLVSVGVVLFASALYHGLKETLASKEEIRIEIQRTEHHLQKLKARLEEKGDIELGQRGNISG
ncbi:hypothetical protein N0V90_008633 [Kalmusia sp. IMI 367209]|nr:hypothetical protein N0V90_008633 [Kalmusia sp. IMI 367209]